MMTITRFALLALGAFLVLTVAVSVLALKETQRRMAALQSERTLAATRSGQLEYIRWGEGAPVLVIHGAGGGFDQGRLLADATHLKAHRTASSLLKKGLFPDTLGVQKAA